MSLTTTSLALRLGRSTLDPSAADIATHGPPEPAARRRTSAPLAIILLSVLVLAIPGTFFALIPHRGPGGSELVLIYLVVALSGTRLSLLVAGPQIRIFESVLWSFYYAFFGIAPLVQQVSGSWPRTTPDLPPGSVAGAGLIILVSAIALLVGSTVRPNRTPRPALPALSAGPAPSGGLGIIPRHRLWAAFGIFLAAGSVHYSRIGLSHVFDSRQATKGLKDGAYATATEGVLVWALASVPLLCLAIALILGWRRSRPALAGRVATIAVVTVTAVVFNPLSNARFVFGAALLGLIGACGAYATLARFRLFVSGLLASIVLVFPYLDIARYDRQDLAPGKGGPLQALTTGDFDAFAQTANTWAFLQELGPTWGRQALGVLLFWVPRSTWADKPEDTGILLAHFRHYTFTNLSAPLPSEIIINFSWVGLVVICVLIGRGMLRLDLRIDRSLRAGSTGSVLSYVLPFYMIILLRGSLLQAMAFLVTILAAGRLLRFSDRAAHRDRRRRRAVNTRTPAHRTHQDRPGHSFHDSTIHGKPARKPDPQPIIGSRRLGDGNRWADRGDNAS